MNIIFNITCLDKAIKLKMWKDQKGIDFEVIQEAADIESVEAAEYVLNKLTDRVYLRDDFEEIVDQANKEVSEYYRGEDLFLEFFVGTQKEIKSI